METPEDIAGGAALPQAHPRRAAIPDSDCGFFPVPRWVPEKLNRITVGAQVERKQFNG
jgi:hypothetical protein